MNNRKPKVQRPRSGQRCVHARISAKGVCRDSSFQSFNQEGSSGSPASSRDLAHLGFTVMVKKITTRIKYNSELKRTESLVVRKEQNAGTQYSHTYNPNCQFFSDNDNPNQLSYQANHLLENKIEMHRYTELQYMHPCFASPVTY